MFIFLINTWIQAEKQANMSLIQTNNIRKQESKNF